MTRTCSLPGCSNIVKCRCSVCKTWYCSQACQEDHWPSHSRDCAPVPDLEWPPPLVTRLRSDSDSGVASAACTALPLEDRGRQNNPEIRESETRGEVLSNNHKIEADQQVPNNEVDKLNEIQKVQKRIFKLHSLENVNSIDDFCIRLQNEVSIHGLNFIFDFLSLCFV